MSEKIQEWPRSTRWIHVGFALIVTFLLFSELDMKAIWNQSEFKSNCASEAHVLPQPSE